MTAAATSHPFLEPPIHSGDLGQLGHYRVIDELGKGGMGFVFRAEDVKLKRPVALKVMNLKIAATPHSRRRFLHEARTMAAVHHDHVVTIFEVGESKGTPFMAMELLQGSTLEDFNSRSHQFGYDEIIELARQLTRGLAAAHQRGIVHRDIKPANIWIQADSHRAKILDFGLALASVAVDQLAGRGAVIGTPGYLSPEQARSDPLDDRSDLYSLGVVLYELCASRLPFGSNSVTEQLISILAHRPTPIGELNPTIPAPLCELIHRLLRKEPRSRPRSAQNLLEQLDRIEAECHAKSEVAQAISKLQVGLREVVQRQTTKSIFVDDSLPVEPRKTNPASNVPRRPAPSLAPSRASTSMRTSTSTSTSRSPWLAHWPLALLVLVVVVVLIAVPLVTFLFV